MTDAKFASDFLFTTDTPYLALTLFCKDVGENLPGYNGTAL